MKTKLKYTLIASLVLLGTLLFITLIWWNGYVPPLDPGKMVTGTIVLKADIPSQSGSPLRGVLIGATEETALKSVSGFKKTLARWALKLAFPRKINAYGVKLEGETAPVYLYSVDFGKGIKIVRMVQDRIPGKIFKGAPSQDETVNGYPFISRQTPIPEPGFKGINACAWVGSGLLLCTDAGYLRRAIEGYDSEAIIPPPSGKIMTISIDNSSGYLTELIRYYEQKMEYEIFSTADRVKSVDIELSPVNSDTMKAFARFNTGEAIATDDLLVNDVDFFYGVARRGLRPQGIELNGTVTSEGSAVVLQGDLTGFRQALSKIESL